MKSSVPDSRIRPLNDHPLRPRGDYVLYRMWAFRRLNWNFSLQRAVEWARELDRPLVIYEELAIDPRWASERSHGFVLDGISDHLQASRPLPVIYYPCLESAAGEGKALLEALCRRACLLVEDDAPGVATVPDHVPPAARPCRAEAIDSNGLLPLRVTDRDYPTAYSFRRFLQRELPRHLPQRPLADPLTALGPLRSGRLPAALLERWPPVSVDLLQDRAWLKRLPIDHRIGRVQRRGGPRAAAVQLETFLDERLARYSEDRNEPEKQATSELSAYLRHGHLAAQQVFHAIAEQQGWSLQRLGPRPTGQRAGWWGMDAASEAFLDQLVTWRELGCNMAVHRPDHRDYAALPEWARSSLAKHRDDPRPRLYSLEQFEQARTHDPLWNAAQNQLRREGLIHNYLRMLWGKKILEWTPSGEEAAAVMIELNNRYALDGCDANSYSGIYWCLGRYDRAWGPERPIFGKIRYMTSANTARKYAVGNYIKWYDGNSGPGGTDAER